MTLEEYNAMRQREELYVMYQGDTPVAYAYGEPWVAQAMYMDDWKYPTEEAARAAWENYKKRGQ